MAMNKGKKITVAITALIVLSIIAFLILYREPRSGIAICNDYGDLVIYRGTLKHGKFYDTEQVNDGAFHNLG